MASKVFDVSVDNFLGMAGWFGAGDQQYQIWMTHTPGREIVAESIGANLEANRLVSCSGGGISMYTHCETHIDTFNHFGYNGKNFNDFSAEEHLRQPRLDQMRDREARAHLRARGVARYRHDAGHQGPAAKLRNQRQIGSGPPRPGRYCERRGT